MTVSISSVNNKAYSDMQSMTQSAQDGSSTQNQTIASIKVGDTDAEKHGNRKYLIAGASVGGVLLLGFLGIGLLSKGTSGGFSKKLREFVSNLKTKTYDLSTSTQKLTLVQKAKLKLAHIVEPTAEFLEASSNMNVIKDGLTLKTMKVLHMEWLANWINKGFKKVVLTTKNDAYRSADMANTKFCSFIEELAKKPNAKGKNLDKASEKITNAFLESFSTKQHATRSESLWGQLENLHDKVWNSFSLLKKENNLFSKPQRPRLKSYITMDMCAPERNAVGNIIKNKKTLLSNNISDNQKILKDALGKLKAEVNPSDEAAVKLMQKLELKLQEYSKLSGPNEASQRLELSNVLKDSLNELAGTFKETQNKKIGEQIENFKRVLNPNTAKKGQVQEALTTVKEIFGKDSLQYKQAKKYADKYNETLNNAINTEMTAYEKLAELRMGSAPTDILGILFPAAVGAWFVARSKDKDERITNTLTKGIPIFGGIGTALYGTARMYTGPKNMAFGLISGALLSVVGAKVDELYKAYSKKQTAFKKEYESLKLAQMNTKAQVKSEVM